MAVYSHDEGCSITGGVVYRGHDLPQLRGRYVFSDFCSGTIWSLPASGGRASPLGVPAVQQLSSFGVDASGELLAVSLDDTVRKFVAGG